MIYTVNEMVTMEPTGNSEKSEPQMGNIAAVSISCECVKCSVEVNMSVDFCAERENLVR